MAIVLVAVPGLFVSLYLLLYRLGFYGIVLCGAGGGCEVVQTSRYAEFLGVPVAGWGVLWYAAVVGVGIWALNAGRTADRRVAQSFLALAATGVAFTLYLTVLEAFVIGAWCRWCLVSAGLVLTISLLTLPEARLLREG